MNFIEKILNPNAASSPGGHEVSRLIWQCKRALWFVAGITMVTEILALTPIIFMWNAFDRVVSSRSATTLVSLITLVMVVYGFWSALEWIRTRMLIRISLRIDWDIAAQVFDAAFRRHVMRKEVDVHQCMNDVVQLRQFLTGPSILALMSAPYAIIYIVIGYVFHPYLAAFIFVAFLLQILAAYYTGRVTTPQLREANNASSEASRVAAQCLSNSETVLALGMHKTVRKIWFKKHQSFLGLQVNASESAGLMGGFNTYLGHALPSMQIALAAYLAIMGHITGGMMMVVTMLLAKSIGPIKKVMSGWPSIQAARQALERLNQLVDEDIIHKEKMKLPAPVGFLVVENLILQPKGASKPIIYNVSFTSAPGQTIAIIGPSAAGKTSLIRSLVGVVAPQKGHVRMDGVEVSEWIQSDLGQYIGYVPQEIDVFEGTVAENIARLGDVDPEKVVAAAKAINMHEAILALPQGYETRLGRTGHALTGGQRQKLAIARAVYNEPVYLVMDEPNAALDDAAERDLIKLVLQLRAKGCLVVYSSHRPKLIGAATHGLIMKSGQIAAFGPMAEVLGRVRQAAASGAAEAGSDQPEPPPRPNQPGRGGPALAVVSSSGT